MYVCVCVCVCVCVPKYCHFPIKRNNCISVVYHISYGITVDTGKHLHKSLLTLHNLRKQILLGSKPTQPETSHNHKKHQLMHPAPIAQQLAGRYIEIASGKYTSLIMWLARSMMCSLTYRQISNISRTKSQKWNVSRFVLQLSLPNPLRPGVESIMKM